MQPSGSHLLALRWPCQHCQKGIKRGSVTRKIAYFFLGEAPNVKKVRTPSLQRLEPRKQRSQDSSNTVVAMIRFIRDSVAAHEQGIFRTNSDTETS